VVVSLRFKMGRRQAVRAGLAVEGASRPIFGLLLIWVSLVARNKNGAEREPTSNAATGPFSTQPSGPRSAGCFSALLTRPVPILIWALLPPVRLGPLEKHPTDLLRITIIMRDGTLVSGGDGIGLTARRGPALTTGHLQSKFAQEAEYGAD
jgi:hypothetical protein